MLDRPRELADLLGERVLELLLEPGRPTWCTNLRDLWRARARRRLVADGESARRARARARATCGARRGRARALAFVLVAVGVAADAEEHGHVDLDGHVVAASLQPLPLYVTGASNTTYCFVTRNCTFVNSGLTQKNPAGQTGEPSCRISAPLVVTIA